MKINIPIKKSDDQSAVIARDFPIFNAPIVNDYRGIKDESKKDKTIIDDRKNPFDKTLPVLIEIVREIGHHKNFKN